MGWQGLLGDWVGPLAGGWVGLLAGDWVLVLLWQEHDKVNEIGMAYTSSFRKKSSSCRLRRAG